MIELKGKYNTADNFRRFGWDINVLNKGGII